MKNFFLVFPILLFFQIMASAQPCLSEGITFNTQSQVDNFQVNYPNCTKISGGVTIMGDDITNLNGLSVLTSIGGSLSIDDNNALTCLTGLNSVTSIGGSFGIGKNSALTSLTGLEGLTSIGQDLVIYTNDALTNLTGLECLTSIGGGLYIGYSNYYNGNDALTSLTGLEGLNSVGDQMVIASNDALTSLNGLQGLNTIGGHLYIEMNKALISLTGLEGLNFIGEFLYIGYNNALTSLTGLQGLNSIQTYFQIYRNDALTSLAGLVGLTSIGEGLYISYNDALTSLTGLDNIDAGLITNLFITDNNSLSSCDVQSVCDYLVNPNGTVYIFGNATGCNSQEEVEAACAEGLEENINSNYCSVFPNPFSGQTTFSIELEDPAHVNLVVLNNLGQVVATIVDEFLDNGEHQVTWNAEDLPAGIYFYRISTIGHRQSAIGKIVVMKSSSQ